MDYVRFFNVERFRVFEIFEVVMVFLMLFFESVCLKDFFLVIVLIRI